jgi:hypothetical protein
MIVGFWFRYIGRGEAIGVMFVGYPLLYICGCIGGCEHAEFGLE